MSIGRLLVKPPSKRRCKNCPRFFPVNPARPDEKKYCCAACKMEWNRYGGTDMVKQREFIELHISRQFAAIRKELGLPARPPGGSVDQ